MNERTVELAGLFALSAVVGWALVESMVRLSRGVTIESVGIFMMVIAMLEVSLLFARYLGKKHA